jgi:aryl-alcohol dehydrogenase-like predicted oxidoreductase
MQRRKLGHTSYQVAPLAFGGNVFGWTADEPTSFALLDAFVGNGFNLIDTADSYSRWVEGHKGGESETIIGKWIARRGRHDDVVIATKVGSDMGLGYKCLKRDYIMRAAEDSLRRLGVDAIDLYQSHWDDDTTPFDETLEAYSRLMQQGKVKAIGASNLTAARLAQALETSQGERTAGVCHAAAALQPDRARIVRGCAAGPVRARGDRRHSVLLARGGIPHRQVPQRAGPGQEQARAGAQEVPASARPLDPRRR